MDGKEGEGTKIGAVVSLIMLAIFAWYAYLKFNIMIAYGETTVFESEPQDIWTADDVNTDLVNFNVAFGITAYDGVKESIEDPDIGTMVAIYREWGLEEGVGSNEYEIPTRPCTYADFGLDEDGNLIE